MARHTPLVLALALLGTTVSQNMIRDGSFEGGGPAVSGGTGWAKVQISDCACDAPGALMVRSAEQGSFAELTFRASHPAGVFVFEALGKLSLDYVGSAEIYSLTAFNGATEVAHAVQRHIFFNATQRFAAWHLYSLQLVCPSAVTSVLLRIGSGEPSEQASGSFNSTDLTLTYAGGDALPVLSRGLAVAGPMGQFSRGPSLVTDGVTLRPPLNNNHWKVVAFTDRLKQLELDLGEVQSVCGTRLVQTQEYYATRWCVCCANSLRCTSPPMLTAGTRPSTICPAAIACSLPPLHRLRSIFGATGEYGPWSKIAEAVPLDELEAAGPDRTCTGAWSGEAGCSLVEAADSTSISLWPCRRVRYVRLDLEEPNDCCYQILEWETLGLGSGAFCAAPCMNGGKCAVAYSGAQPQCDCPISYGWMGPLAGCTVRNAPALLHSDTQRAKDARGACRAYHAGLCLRSFRSALCNAVLHVTLRFEIAFSQVPICTGGCQNGGRCVWAQVCDCAPGYYGRSCTEEFCGDGAQSHGEVCDDGNFKGNDGCVRCDLENNDPGLVWPSNTSLAVQWSILYPPTTPAPPGLALSYIDTGDGGGVIVVAVTLIGLTHIFACCCVGVSSSSPISDDLKKQVARRAQTKW